MNAFRTIWHDILLVWTFFTRIPAPHFMTERKLSQALWALPLVGIAIWVVLIFVLTVLGELGGIAAQMERQSSGFLSDAWNSDVPGQALVLVLIPIALTGAIHWDGLADLFDGLGVNRDRRLVVMRDSAIGTFGVIALISVFALQWHFYESAFWNVEDILLILIASRAFMALNWALSGAIDSESQTSKLGQPNWFPQLLTLSLCLAILLLLGSFSWLGVIVLIFAALGWSLLVRYWIGGASGDGLGAIQVVSETILIFCVAIF